MRVLHPLLRQAAALDPYQILAVPRSASAPDIKAAYLKLAKQHHPDLPSSSKPSKCDFTDIVAAFELLKDPKKRKAYDLYGVGAGSGSSSDGINYQNMHRNPWGNPKSRPYKHAYQRGRYPSSSWDYGHSKSTDFYSHNTSENGVYTSNVSFFSILAGLSLLLYSVQFWRLAPPLTDSSSSSAATSSGIPGVGLQSFTAMDPRDAPIYKSSSLMNRDKHHDQASSALAAARQDAQRFGTLRRDGIRRRVRENSLEAIESGQAHTGHDIESFNDLIAINEDPTQYKRTPRSLDAQQHPSWLQLPRPKAKASNKDQPPDGAISAENQSKSVGA